MVKVTYRPVEEARAERLKALRAVPRRQVEASVCTNPDQWPLLIRGIARRRIETDKGVGDTVERILAKMGGRQFKWVMKRLNLNCGCGGRQAWLNARYSYKLDSCG